MKGLFVVLAAIVAVTQGAPSRSFTAKEYEALQHALGDRIPVAIQSGIRILSAVESNPTDFVVLNFDGLSRGGGGILPRTSVAVSDGEIISARTGAAADDDDVAETFSEVAEDAVESVREAAEDAAEAAVVDAISRTAVIEDNSDTVTDNTAASAAAEITPETEASTTAAASPTTTAAEATETSAVSRTGLAADAVVEEDAPAAAAAAAVEDEAAVDATPAQVIAQIESARRKRQNDVQNEYATSLSFALQFLGLELGGNVGRFLDDIFNANLKFIENMQGTGELVLDQVDGFLARNRNSTKKSS